MVYIHGGAYMWGSSGIERYSPDYLLMKDVVLVTLNYRVGAFGKPRAVGRHILLIFK